MEQYSKTQIKKIMEVLENKMATVSGKAFDKMERARRDLKSWDGTGALPHEKALRELNILEALNSNYAETLHNVEKPVSGDEKKQPVAQAKQDSDPRVLVAHKIVQVLVSVLEKENDKEKSNVLHTIAKSLDDWAKNGAKGEIPHLSDLKEMGLLLKPVLEPLVITAHAVDRDRKNDFKGRKQAWRAVRDLNPEYQEAHEALQQIERDEIRFSNLYKAKQYLKEAEEGDRSDNLPMLNDALVESQALLARVTDDPSLSDLVDEVQRTTKLIEDLRRETRDRLGIMATAEGQGKHREAYETTRVLIERSSRPPTIMKEDGTEVNLSDYWYYIRKEFTSWLRKKALDYLQDAQSVAQSYPELAREKLINALNILDDNILTREDRILFDFDVRSAIRKEIEKVEQILAVYEKVRMLVVEGQRIDVPIAQRIECLLRAKELFPNYPNITAYIEKAQKEYLQQKETKDLEGKISDLIRRLKTLLPKEKYEEVLSYLERADALLQNMHNQFEKIRDLIDGLTAVKNREKRDEVLESLNAVSLFFEVSISDQIKKIAAQPIEAEDIPAEKALLILDIDECLIHSSDDPLDPNTHFEAAGYNVIKRPFLDEFLENVAQLYDLAIWTGATEEYVKYISPKTIPEMVQLKFVWSRSHCTLKFDYERNENYWLKDIKKVERFGYTQERILFVENDPRSLDRNYGNMIRIIPFSGERHDEELRLLLRFLRRISKAENMRKVEKRNWRDTVL